MTPLTDHFTFEELGVLGEEQRIVSLAVLLCTRFLEPIRAHYGTPIRVHCAYRDPQHNARVGGKPDSFHLFEGGECAVDFSLPNQDTESVFNWIRLHSGLPFDKVILERGKNGAAACIHLQYDAAKMPRRAAYVGSVGAAFDYQRVEVA